MNENDMSPTVEQPKLILEQIESELQALSNMLSDCIAKTRVVMDRNGLLTPDGEKPIDNAVKGETLPQRVNIMGMRLGYQTEYLESCIDTIAKSF